MQVADVQARTQIELADRQFQAQRAIEEDKFCRQKLETAYEAVTEWLDGMERLIDEPWGHICADGPEHREAARKIVDDWPWETLRPPLAVSRLSYCWSEEVRELIYSLGGISSKLCFGASVANTNREAPKEKQGDYRRAQSEVWESRQDFQVKVAKTRRTIRKELLGAES
ncbi:hypothetical protein [Actinomadura harenae]|uniref:hypothetical protein n=1 Tax=Actinomadura harenae TaxID=2483351 RepID=UPI0011C48507|nr:hypothetical protein [Actinomadura harenae]